jgi:dCTP deaminase
VTGGILSDTEIRAAFVRGDIEIEPFDTRQMNPASYDLRLGDRVSIYKFADCLDAKTEPSVEAIVIGPEGIVLAPDVGYLMHTTERVHTKRYVPIIDGKSSIARLFVSIHECAGFGDPGYDGQYTLEVTVTHPVRLYAGMRIAQIRFHTVHGEIDRLYDGNYKSNTSRGPVASRAWKQFDK